MTPTHQLKLLYHGAYVTQATAGLHLLQLSFTKFKLDPATQHWNSEIFLTKKDVPNVFKSLPVPLDFFLIEIQPTLAL